MMKKIYGGGLPHTICRGKVCGQPQWPTWKIVGQRHKNRNFEKNGTYIKDSAEASMHTNFYDNPTTFGHRITKKPKRPYFPLLAASRQYVHGIVLFLGPNIILDDILCRHIEDKGSI